MADIYSHEFIYHYKNQPNKRPLSKFNSSGKDINFSCGDEVEVQLLIDNNGKIADFGYKPNGCIISTGTISILSDYIIGKNIENIRKLNKEEILKLIGFEVTPSREKCVMVGVNAIKKAIEGYETKKG